MRAVVCETWGGPETLVLKELPDPEPASGEVCSRCSPPELPFIPGAEVCGEILKTGQGVEHLRVGDRVAAVCQVGGFAEQLALPATQCIQIPRTLDPKIAAGFLLAYGTSWHVFGRVIDDFICSLFAAERQLVVIRGGRYNASA